MTQAFPLRAIMKQGTAGLPETWTHYPSVEAARGGAKLNHNDRVLRVMMVTDGGSFVEWIER